MAPALVDTTNGTAEAARAAHNGKGLENTMSENVYDDRVDLNFIVDDEYNIQEYGGCKIRPFHAQAVGEYLTCYVDVVSEAKHVFPLLPSLDGESAYDWKNCTNRIQFCFHDPDGSFERQIVDIDMDDGEPLAERDNDELADIIEGLSVGVFAWVIDEHEDYWARCC